MNTKTWYYNRNLKPQGPMSLADIRVMIRNGEIKPHDLICYELEGEWKAACEWSIFERTLFPATQEFMPGQDLSLDTKEWVLLVEESGSKNVLQEGPYSLSELRLRLQQKTVSEQQYIWKAGLSGWSRIADRPEFNLRNPSDLSLV